MKRNQIPARKVARDYQSGDSARFLAEKYGCHPRAIRKILLDQGVTLRGQSESVRLAVKTRTPALRRIDNTHCPEVVELTATVAKAISATREKAGYTQHDIDKRLGLYPGTMCRYERGHLMPSLIRLIEIADALNCTLDELAGRNP